MQGSTVGLGLAEQFGLKPGMVWDAVNAPRQFDEMLGGVIRLMHRRPVAEGGLNVLMFFVKDMSDLREYLPVYKNRIRSGGMVWVIWPGLASGMQTNVTAAGIHNVAEPLNLNRSAAKKITEHWQACCLAALTEEG